MAPGHSFSIIYFISQSKLQMRLLEIFCNQLHRYWSGHLAHTVSLAVGIEKGEDIISECIDIYDDKE